MNEASAVIRQDDRGILDIIITLLLRLNPADKIKLLNSFNNEDDFLMQSRRNIEDLLCHKISCFWQPEELFAHAKKVSIICKIRGIKMADWTSDEYPPLLREIYDPPPVLYYRGNLPATALQTTALQATALLAIVGTRRPSPQAASQAYTIAKQAGRQGISVVSGLAIGIDSMAHRGNLDGKAAGFAVLGCGLDMIYPSSNRTLARRIVESGGALISEYLPGTIPFKSHFPARNRIISGLSRSVLVVEAPEKSGALITADFALEQGRDLWVASWGLHNTGKKIYDKNGTAKLADDGAAVIKCADDIFEKWNIKKERNDQVPAQSARELASSMADYLEIKL